MAGCEMSLNALHMLIAQRFCSVRMSRNQEARGGLENEHVHFLSTEVEALHKGG